MPRTVKSLGQLVTTPVTSVEDVQRVLRQMAAKLDEQHRLNRADVEAAETTLADHETRITALEP